MYSRFFSCAFFIRFLHLTVNSWHPNNRYDTIQTRRSIKIKMRSICTNKWNKVFKNGQNKNCGMQPLKNLKAYSLLKQKVKSQFSKFRLRQHLFVFKEFCRETRLSNIFKTTNVTKLTKPILESCYRVLLNVTSKGKSLKQHVYFFEDR